MILEGQENESKPFFPIRWYTVDQKKKKKAKEPKKEKHLTLVLDLDETLIHASKVRPEKDYEPILVWIFQKPLIIRYRFNKVTVTTVKYILRGDLTSTLS